MARLETMKKLCSLVLSCSIVLGSAAVVAADDESISIPSESQLQDIVKDDFTSLSGKDDTEIREALQDMGYTIKDGTTDSLTFSATEEKGLLIKRSGTKDEMQIGRLISDDNGITKDTTLKPNHNMKGGGKYYVEYTFAYDRTAIFLSGTGNWKNVFCRTQISKQYPKDLTVYGATDKYKLSDVNEEMRIQAIVDTKGGNLSGSTSEGVSNVFVNGEHIAVNSDNKYVYNGRSYYITFLQSMSFILQGGQYAVDGGGLYLKNFRVAKIDETVKKTDSELAGEDRDALKLNKTDAVIADFEVPTVGSVNGSEITWESSNDSVISIADGKAVVTRPDNDTVVTLTATIKCGEATVTKEFTVTVNGAAVPEVEPGTNIALGKNASGSAKPYGDSFNYSMMTDGDKGTRLALNDWADLTNEYIDVDLGADYTFNNIKIFENNGRLRKFKLQYSQDKETWTDIGEYTSSDEYTVDKNWVIGFNDIKARYVRLVIEQNVVIDSSHYLGVCIWEFEVYNLTDEEKVNEDKNALALENTNGVKGSFTLPTSGSINASEITWQSSDSSVISIDGDKAVVTRPEEDAAVTLTATIQSGEAKATKEFVVTVVAKDPPAAIVVGKNLALNKTVDGNAPACSDDYGYAKVTDGDLSSRLALKDGTNHNGSWIRIDLGENYKFNKINIMEFRKRLKKFKLQYSADGSSWQDIGEYSTGANNEDAKPYNLLSYSFGAVEGRYVRILIEENAQSAGISLHEVEVYYEAADTDYVKNLSYTFENGNVSFSYEKSDSAADKNIYAAVYNSDNDLEYVTTELSGSFEGNAKEAYTFKLLTWDSDMKPVSDPIVVK